MSQGLASLKYIEDLAKQAGQKIIDVRSGPEWSGQSIYEKSDASLVTKADLAAEKHIVDSIQSDYPDDLIWTEEAGLLGDELIPGQKVWIVDPLDGTTNFIHGLPLYSVSIALGLVQESGHIEVHSGAIYQPEVGDMYSARLGEGALYNGKRLHVSDHEVKLSQCLVAGGFSYHRGDDLRHDSQRIEAVGNLCRSLRVSGSCSLDMSYVASNRFDVYVEVGIKAWDIAAGSVVIREAGGHLLSFSGFKHSEFDVRYNGIICGKKGPVEEVLGVLGSEEDPLGLFQEASA